MNFLSRDFLSHRGVSKTTYRGTWNRSNVWRLGPLCLGFQLRTDSTPLISGITGANSVRGQPHFAWKKISDRGELSRSEFESCQITSLTH